MTDILPEQQKKLNDCVRRGILRGLKEQSLITRTQIIRLGEIGEDKDD